MRQIGSIYFNDLKRIITNWAALAVVFGLIVLPSLYAWFNIKASWDPYGNTRGIKIAVANQDQGARFNDKNINVGEEVIRSLHHNKKLGWTFVNEREAINGVKYGQYYAAIIIPKDFSRKIASVLSENPQKAEMNYFVNEKINAVAPKMTEKGASIITEQISRNFVKEATAAIF